MGHPSPVRGGPLLLSMRLRCLHGTGRSGHYKVVGGLTAGHLFMASDGFGKVWRKLQRPYLQNRALTPNHLPFKILSS